MQQLFALSTMNTICNAEPHTPTFPKGTPYVALDENGSVSSQYQLGRAPQAQERKPDPAQGRNNATRSINCDAGFAF